MQRSIQNSKRNTHERPYTVPSGSQHPVDHRNRHQQDSNCRCTTTAIHTRWDKTGSPSDIHIIQLHSYPTSLGVPQKEKLYAIYVAMRKLSYMIKDSRVTITTDHKPLLEIVAGTAKSQNSAAADKFHRWTNDILAGDPHPTIQYKKGSLNLIADSLSRLRTGDHYKYNTPLHNDEPLVLKKKAEINMVTTRAKSAEQDQLPPKLPDLQIKVRDIFKTMDKRQLIRNAEKVLNDLEPAKLRELQNTDQSIINLKNSRKQSVIADKDNILRMKVDYKGDVLEAILLPKVLRPWIIASTHEFYGHQGGDRCYNKIRATYYWSGMKNDICQAISNCKICKMESPNLGKYMNLHLEIG